MDWDMRKRNGVTVNTGRSKPLFHTGLHRWIHKDTNPLCRYTVMEMGQRMGGLRSVLHNPPPPAPATPEQKARISLLPKNFDWRDVEGVNYVAPVRDQGGCGSCYVFASMAMIESRLRIKTNNQRQDVFSTQVRQGKS
uniref:Peptidase C1A papain C-terminal domain-containing protein n=1 Tax=Scylla olivacea TaxID=85551 RepID=A0A0P4WE72_SCYOL